MFASNEEVTKEMAAVMKSVYVVMQDPELGSAMAKMYKNIYESLQKEGFTSEQALQIVCSMDMMKTNS